LCVSLLKHPHIAHRLKSVEKISFLHIFGHHFFAIFRQQFKPWRYFVKISNSSPLLPAATQIPARTPTIEQKSAEVVASSSARPTTVKIDFTNITPEQLQGTVNDLLKSGKMSFDESSPLIGLVPTALAKVDYDGKAPDAYTQPMNVLDRLQDGLAWMQDHQDKKGADAIKKTLAALNRIQRTGESDGTWA
jgi:hypothetical protein